jgi:hypothetical protein
MSLLTPSFSNAGRFTHPDLLAEDEPEVLKKARQLATETSRPTPCA